MKKIKENEEFQMGGYVFTYSEYPVGIKLNRIRKSDEKPTKTVKPFVAPSVAECMDYFLQNGYLASAGQQFYKFYSAADWKDSNGKQVKNWKQKAIGVWFREEYAIPTEKQKMVR